MTSSDTADLPISRVISRQSAREALNRLGIYTVGQLARVTVEHLLTLPGIGARTAPLIHARASAFASGRPYWIQTQPPSLATRRLFLDIRVDPDTLPQAPWGFCSYQPSGTARFVCVDPLRSAYQITLDGNQTVQFVPHLLLAWQLLAEQIADQEMSVYYWGKVIRRHLQQTAPISVQNRLKPQLMDLLDLFADTVVLPVQSSGLQPVASYLGYRWRGAEAPYEAHIAYLFWIREQRLDLLQEACAFMQQNARAVEHIGQWLMTHAPI